MIIDHDIDENANIFEKTNVQMLNDASIGANDAACQPESVCESASMTVIASDSFTERQRCQPTSNLQNSQGSTSSNVSQPFLRTA